jgi:hypothetical protein
MAELNKLFEATVSRFEIETFNFEIGRPRAFPAVLKENERGDLSGRFCFGPKGKGDATRSRKSHGF